MEDPAALDAVKGKEMFSVFPRGSDLPSPNANNLGLLGLLCEDVDEGREVGTLISLE